MFFRTLRRVSTRVRKVGRRQSFLTSSRLSKFLLGAAFGGAAASLVLIGSAEDAPEQKPRSLYALYFDKNFGSRSYINDLVFKQVKEGQGPKLPAVLAELEEPEYPEAPASRLEEEYYNHEVFGIEDNEWVKNMRMPETKKVIEYVNECRYNDPKFESLHPWFPSDRRLLELFWSQGDALKDSLGQPLILPKRTVMPYGKPITILIDQSCLQNKHGTRPGWERFLAYLSLKYEVIIYNKKLVPMIDDDMQYVSAFIAPILAPNTHADLLKSILLLNRPFESTIIMDSSPAEVFPNPSNAIILKEWDGKDLNDQTLKFAQEFFEVIAQKVVTQKTPVYEICPKFQDIHKDFVELWKANKKTPTRLFEKS